MPTPDVTRVPESVVGSGDAEQVVALCHAIDAITASMEDSIERLPDPAHGDVFALPGIFTVGTEEIRNRLDAWLAVEQQIVDGQAERCELCGDVLPLDSMLAHRSNHQGATR